MTSLSLSLSQHYRHCDRLLAAACDAATAADWPVYARLLADLGAALRGQLAFEEEALFPAFEHASRSRSGPTVALRSRHAAMRALLATLEAAAPQFDPDGCCSELVRLRGMLAEHNSQEEAVIYPAGERLLDARPDLLAAARALDRAPSAPREIDVRGLEPPEPFMRIMEQLNRSPRETLRVLIHREPLPLYDVLSERGLRYRARPLEGGNFEIVIEPAAR